MSMLELYQEVILDHNKSPRNFRDMDCASHKACGKNPLCGDELDLFLNIEDGVIQDVSFTGTGCAISVASASLLTEKLKGRTVTDAEAIYREVHMMLTGESDVDPAELGKLAVLSGVCQFPVRVKCASLAWHTMHAALQDSVRRRVDGVAMLKLGRKVEYALISLYHLDSLDEGELVASREIGERYKVPQDVLGKSAASTESRRADRVCPGGQGRLPAEAATCGDCTW